MKGRAVTTREKAFHDLMCREIGCAACWFGHQSINTHCSIHHPEGRTVPHAHWVAYPLCGGHHQGGFGNDSKIFAVHKNKTRFVAMYGTERDLLARCIGQLLEYGYTLPDEAMRYAA